MNCTVQRLLLEWIIWNNFLIIIKTHILRSQVFHASSNLEGEADEVLGCESEWVGADGTCSLWWFRMQRVDVVIVHCLMLWHWLVNRTVQSVNKATAVLHQVITQTSVSTVLHNHIESTCTKQLCTQYNTMAQTSMSTVLHNHIESTSSTSK